MYNLTNLTNVQGIGGLVTFGNQTTSGLLVGLFMVAIFIIILMYQKSNFPFYAIFLADSFACFALSLILAYGGFLNPYFVLFFLICLGFAMLYSVMQQKTG